MRCLFKKFKKCSIYIKTSNLWWYEDKFCAFCQQNYVSTKLKINHNWVHKLKKKNSVVTIDKNVKNHALANCKIQHQK